MRYNHTMSEYKKIKDELTRRHEKTTHFTRRFFDDFNTATKNRAYAIKEGIDESYKRGYITLFHSYDPIYASDFYNRNGGAYCAFLEIINSK